MSRINRWGEHRQIFQLISAPSLTINQLIQHGNKCRLDQYLYPKTKKKVWIREEKYTLQTNKEDLMIDGDLSDEERLNLFKDLSDYKDDEPQYYTKKTREEGYLFTNKQLYNYRYELYPILTRLIINKFLLTNVDFMNDIKLFLIKNIKSTLWKNIVDKEYYSVKGDERYYIYKDIAYVGKGKNGYKSIRNLWKKYKYEFFLLVFGFKYLKIGKDIDVDDKEDEIWNTLYEKYDDDVSRFEVEESLNYLAEDLTYYCMSWKKKKDRKEVKYNYEEQSKGNFKTSIIPIDKLRFRRMRDIIRKSDKIIRKYSNPQPRKNKGTYLIDFKTRMREDECLYIMNVHPKTLNMSLKGKQSDIYFPKQFIDAMYHTKGIRKKVEQMYDERIHGIKAWGYRIPYVDEGVSDAFIYDIWEDSFNSVDEVIALRREGSLEYAIDNLVDEDEVNPLMIWMLGVNMNIDEWWVRGINFSKKYLEPIELLKIENVKIGDKYQINIHGSMYLKGDKIDENITTNYIKFLYENGLYSNKEKGIFRLRINQYDETYEGVIPFTRFKEYGGWFEQRNRYNIDQYVKLMKKKKLTKTTKLKTLI